MPQENFLRLYLIQTNNPYLDKYLRSYISAPLLLYALTVIMSELLIPSLKGTIYMTIDTE